MNGTTHTELFTPPWASSLLYLNGGRRGVVGSGIRRRLPAHGFEATPYNGTAGHDSVAMTRKETGNNAADSDVGTSSKCGEQRAL